MTDDVLLCINLLSVLVNLVIMSQEGVMLNEAHVLMTLAGFSS